MDEDTAIGLIFILSLFTVPIGIVSTILACTAWSRTRAWKKQRALLAQPGSQPLVEDEESQDDFLDTEDEEDYKTKKAEKLADRNLTTRQKFRKELKKAWKGNGPRDLVKQREREERRKIAKAVAREIERLERRRARQQGRTGDVGSSRVEEGLPRYEVAVSGDTK